MSIKKDPAEKQKGQSRMMDIPEFEEENDDEEPQVNFGERQYAVAFANLVRELGHEVTVEGTTVYYNHEDLETVGLMALFYLKGMNVAMEDLLMRAKTKERHDANPFPRQ